MPINLTKLTRSLSRTKRTKGVEPDRVLERSWVSYAVRYFERVQRDLWADLEPSLKRLLPEQAQGSTVDSIGLREAFRRAEERFRDLSTIKAKADVIFSEADARNRLRFRRLLKEKIGVSLDDSTASMQTRAQVEKHVSASVDLISTVNENHFRDFKNLIYSGIRDGTDFHSLRKAVLGATGGPAAGYPSWMVERIAVDQYLKLHGKITEIRQKGAGVTHYFWRTAGDARVRQSHLDNDGERFSWDEPPGTGHPGEEIRCRCIADPDFSTVPNQLIEQADFPGLQYRPLRPAKGWR